MERGPREVRLPQRHHPPLVQPLPHLIEGMMTVQNRQDQGFDPPPSRQLMRRVGRNEASITVATSRRRKTPRTNGKCAMGSICCTAMAMMHLLSSFVLNSLIAQNKLIAELHMPSQQKSSGSTQPLELGIKLSMARVW